MGCLGVHFALTEAEVQTLLDFEDEQDRLDHIQVVIEEDYLSNQREFCSESDKAWDAIHRALGDGEMSLEGGSYPLNHAILGGASLYDADDYIISLKTPAQVKDVAAALTPLTRDEFHQRYWSIDSRKYGRELDDDDFEYTWEWLQAVRDLYRRAADSGRFVLFTADQ